MKYAVLGGAAGDGDGGVLSCGRGSGEAGRQAAAGGRFDSRAIAIAYTSSKYNDNFMVGKSKAKHEAEAAGDSAAVERIDKEMQYFQFKRHLQGCGTAPVPELLKCIEKEIAAIAREAGVDVIVSKWAFDYRAEGTEVVDLTAELVAAFEPTERAMKWIRQLETVAPVSEAELLQHELEGGH